MTLSAQSNVHFSQVLRRQLQDLRIDPDSVSAVRRQPAPNRIRTWFAGHKEAALTVGVGVGVLGIIFGVVLALAMSLDRSPTPARNAAQISQTSVSSGDITVPMMAPDYRYMAPGQASLTLHVNLHNPTDAQLQLRAGDVLLVNPHGASFPPSWQSFDGTSHDGLTDPNHVFVALDANADVAIDLEFLVLSNGPFTLRYQRQDETLNSQLPELTLDTPTN